MVKLLSLEIKILDFDFEVEFSAILKVINQPPTSPKTRPPETSPRNSVAKSVVLRPQKIKAHLRWGGHTTARPKDRPPGAIGGALTARWILNLCESDPSGEKLTY